MRKDWPVNGSPWGIRTVIHGQEKELSGVPQVGLLPVWEGPTRRMGGLTCLVSPPERMWCPDDNMADNPHILFNKSPSQLRLLGARAGKACGPNQRPRQARLTTAPAAIPVRVAPQETTARAIAVLGARFPWLAG